jgi:Dimethyladenosine transferase (rRNA methylation)
MRSTRPRKQFAQHWLKSEKALDKIVKAASLDGDRVLEIGPGTGILTRRLLPAAESVVAVEIDRDLCLKLAKQLGKTDNFLLLQGDILEMDLEAELTPFPNSKIPIKLLPIFLIILPARSCKNCWERYLFLLLNPSIRSCS